MWWKIAVAVICAVILISPIDLSLGHIGIDDILAALGMVTTLLSTFKGLKDRKNDNINDVNDN